MSNSDDSATEKPTRRGFFSKVALAGYGLAIAGSATLRAARVGSGVEVGMAEQLRQSADTIERGDAKRAKYFRREAANAEERAKERATAGNGFALSALTAGAALVAQEHMARPTEQDLSPRQRKRRNMLRIGAAAGAGGACAGGAFQSWMYYLANTDEGRVKAITDIEIPSESNPQQVAKKQEQARRWQGAADKKRTEGAVVGLGALAVGSKIALNKQHALNVLQEETQENKSR